MGASGGTCGRLLLDGTTLQRVGLAVVHHGASDKDAEGVGLAIHDDVHVDIPVGNLWREQQVKLFGVCVTGFRVMFTIMLLTLTSSTGLGNISFVICSGMT